MSTVTTNELKRYGLPEDDTVMFEQFLNDTAGYNVEKMDSEITRLDAAIDGKLKLNNENLSNVNFIASDTGVESINGVDIIGDRVVTTSKTDFLNNMQNLIDATTIVEGKYWGDAYNKGNNPNFACYEAVAIKPNQTYTLSSCVDLVHTFAGGNDGNDVLYTLSNLVYTKNADGSYTFVNPSNSYWIRISGTPIDKMKQCMLIRNSKLPSDFVPYETPIVQFDRLRVEANQIYGLNAKIEQAVIDGSVKTNIISVATAQALVTAINSIATGESNNKANSKNRYIIYLASGTYELYDVIDKSAIQDQVLYKRGLEIPDYVSLIGIGNVTIKCTLPATESNANVQAISTISTYAENYFENVTFEATNCRYCVHDDGGGAYKNRKIEFVNCNFIHNGNSIGLWTSQECYGAGYTGGRKGIFKNCFFRSETFLPFYVHNSAPYWATDCFNLELDGCCFETPNSEASVSIQGFYKTGLNNIIKITNCYLDKYLRFNGDYGEFTCYGGGNNNFGIKKLNNSIIRLAETHNIITQ